MASCSRLSDTDIDGTEWCLFRIGTFDHHVVIPLDRNEVVIGRITNKYLKKSPFVSRKHACFIKCDDDWHVEDLGSTNGTYVNNVKINSNCIHPVRPSDIVGLGMAAATSEDHFSFKLIKKFYIKGKYDICTRYTSNLEKENGKRMNSEAVSSDTTIAENRDSVLTEAQLSMLENLQSVQNRIAGIHNKKVVKGTSLTKLELTNSNSRKLRSSSYVQNKDSKVSTDISINNSGDGSPLESNTLTTSETRLQCKVSSLQNIRIKKNLHSKSDLVKGINLDKASCSSGTADVPVVKEILDDQPTSTDNLVDSNNCIDTEFEVASKVRKLQNETINTSNLNEAKEISTKNNIVSKKSKTTDEMFESASVSTKALPELIEIEEPVRRRSARFNRATTMQKIPDVIDLSTTKGCKAKPIGVGLRLQNDMRNRHRKTNVITVPDDGTSIIESIEIKEDIIVLSDCDDDCLVVDDNTNEPIVDFCQPTNDGMENNDEISVSQPSCSNNYKTQIDPITGGGVEVDESSNDTHFSETVDDSVEFDMGKPELNIDENKLFNRLSWPDLPAD